jgi:hypothetical protein
MSAESTMVDIERLIASAERTGEFFGREEIVRFKLPPAAKQFEDIKNRLKAQQRHSGQRYTVMLLGEFNAGKSTFLNVLLGLPSAKRLRVSPRPETARPTRITLRNEGDPLAKWVFSDGSEENKQSWEEALPATSQNEMAGHSSRGEIREIVLFADHPLLQQVDLLDMPGTGTAFHREHTELTREYVRNSEFIFWVIGSQEPSREGRKDFENMLAAEIPAAVLFNAWGFLDETKDRAVRDCVDQKEIEAKVRDDYPEAFREHSEGFRIYAQKCIDALDANMPLESRSDDWGLKHFENWVVRSCFSSFQDRAEVRRRNVVAQVRKISADVVIEIQQWKRPWELELEKSGAEGEILGSQRRRVNGLDHLIRAKIRGLAGSRANTILDRITQAGANFIDDKVRIENFEFFTKLLTFRSKQYLEVELLEEFKRDYLRISESPNWIEDEMEDYVRESWAILEAEWKLFLDEIEFEAPFSGKPGRRPEFPFKAIEESVMAGLKAFITKMIAAGTVIGLMLTIPGVNIAEIAVIGIAALLAAFTDPFAGPRENAKRRMRTETEMQSAGLKNSLLDEIMKGPNKILRDRVNELLGGKTQAHDDKISVMNDAAEFLSLMEEDFSSFS